MADPVRIAELSVPYFIQAGVKLSPDHRGIEFLASAIVMATSSVDRLDQVPGRLALLFDYAADRALADAHVRDEMQQPRARAVVAALAEELASAPRLDRGRFREVAANVRARTGEKGKPLFHPIRVALTGRAEGPELDLAIPAIDRGADLPRNAGLPAIVGCRERAAAFLRALV
jgi:nondiscriminating glutamyl-tRNA synthetase